MQLLFMWLGNGIIGTIVLLFLAGLLISVISVVCCYYFSFRMDDYYYYDEDYDSDNKSKYKEFVDNSLIDQKKRHTINYTNEKAVDYLEKSMNKKLDFDVDFDINVAGSIVKTETIYAE